MKFCDTCGDPLDLYQVTSVCAECEELEQEALESKATSDMLKDDYEDMERRHAEEEDDIDRLYKDFRQAQDEELDLRYGRTYLGDAESEGSVPQTLS